MGCICTKEQNTNGNQGDDYIEFGNYIGDRNCCGQKSGRGQYYYENGDMYDGMWKRNKKHGYGIYTYADGRRLEGFFDNNKWLGEQLHEDMEQDNDGDEPLPENVKTCRVDQKEIDEALLAKHEEQEIRRKKRQERVEEMKKKYGIHQKP